MIFRDKKTGTLLNIRRDEYPNDRLYFQEMIGVIDGTQLLASSSLQHRRYSQPFDESHANTATNTKTKTNM
jgi:hypothetical protein